MFFLCYTTIHVEIKLCFLKELKFLLFSFTITPTPVIQYATFTLKTVLYLRLN